MFRLPFYFLGGGDWKVAVCVRGWYFVAGAVCACSPYLTLQKVSWFLELKYPYREARNLCKWYKILTFLLVSILLKMQSYFEKEMLQYRFLLPQAESEARGQIQSNEVNGITLNLLLYK